MKTTAIAAALGAILLLAPPLAAQSFADPPGRVGRLSYIDGTVSLHAPDQDQWSEAVINYPVTTGDGFWTQPQSRAEVQVGAVEMRLDESTEADIVRLDDAATVLRVDQGVIEVHVIAMPTGGVAVLTPLGQADLLTVGSYHVEAGQPGSDNAPPNQMVVSVLQGRARVAGQRSSLTVEAGESAIASGTGFQLVQVEATSFDNWALARERREAQPTATAWYVPPTMTGYQDLDQSGQWTTDPTYGTVWYPASIPADWAPYRYGHWVWVQPWGWTWVDDAPWGFAPFHYGRWAFIRDRWAWCPGDYHARPVYAPALVAFIGGGITIAVGQPVGWVPLAPGERFHPWYHTGTAYVQRVNYVRYDTHVTNNVVINNYYGTAKTSQFRNARAATVVSSHAFSSAAPVQRSVEKVDPQHLNQARTVATLTHVQPTVEARGAIAHPEAASATSVARPEKNAPAPTATANREAAPSPTVTRGNDHLQPPTPETRAATPAPHPPAPTPEGRPVTPSAPETHVATPAPHPPTPETHAAAPAPHPPTVTPEAKPASPTPTRQAAVTPRVTPPPIPHPFTATPRPAARPLPPVQVQRPVQNTRITPTPQGWQRAPVQPAAAHPPQPQPQRPAPAPHPAPAAHPAPPSQGGSQGGEPQRHP
ncbi:MAG TPA: DUF6600 domain-containing protein [Stellaceae bacterium]|nr:DUF6600 domain-containing protein [Stellaceae bacterium]